eukprot:44897-Rhodomonas_salina.1
MVVKPVRPAKALDRSDCSTSLCEFSRVAAACEAPVVLVNPVIVYETMIPVAKRRRLDTEETLVMSTRSTDTSKAKATVAMKTSSLA